LVGRSIYALDGQSPIHSNKEQGHGCGVTGQPGVVLPTAQNGPPLHRYRSRNINLKRLDSSRVDWAALIDRGANGCIAGMDMKVIERTQNTIDLSGIDDHTVRNLTW
jgi:hypothetical protein